MRLLLIALWLLPGITAAAERHVWQPGYKQLLLWPGTPPGGIAGPDEETVKTVAEPVAGRSWTEISKVSRPTMTIFAPAGSNTGAAVLVFPGGGYKILAIDLEGTEVCGWLTSKGITCVLLKYRVPDSGPHWEKSCDCQVTPKVPAALQDAQRAVGLVRLHAKEWRIDPHKVGVLGFSAGGFLSAAITSTSAPMRGWTRPTGKAAGPISRSRFIPATCGRAVMRSDSTPASIRPATPRPLSCCRQKTTRSTT